MHAEFKGKKQNKTKKQRSALTQKWMQIYKLSFFLLLIALWHHERHYFQYFPSSFGCDSDIALILFASSTLPPPSQPVHLITSCFLRLYFPSSRARDLLCLSWRWRQFSWPFPCGRSAYSSQSSSAVALGRASRSSACASQCQQSLPELGAWSM